jgi:ethanolaminephosphotransferase
MIGFFFSVLPFVLLFSMCGMHMQNQKGMDIPRWFYLVEAFSYFFYRMLDEMDGKQARRTGNSSPLGLLFDHGLDSFTMGLQAMVMSKCCQVGDNMMAILSVAAPCASFHFSTLEEYYTGGLFLPPCNGVTDGSAAVFLVFILMAIVGNDFWRWPVANKGTTSEILFVDIFVVTLVLV